LQHSFRTLQRNSGQASPTWPCGAGLRGMSSDGHWVADARTGGAARSLRCVKNDGSFAVLVPGVPVTAGRNFAPLCISAVISICQSRAWRTVPTAFDTRRPLCARDSADSPPVGAPTPRLSGLTGRAQPTDDPPRRTSRRKCSPNYEEFFIFVGSDTWLPRRACRPSCPFRLAPPYKHICRKRSGVS
jgi:hypothetical protein